MAFALHHAPERHDGVDADRPARREITTGERHDGQQSRCRTERERIERTNTHEHAGHGARDEHGPRQSDCGAGDGESDALSQDQPEDVGGLRAKRQAHSELPGTLADHMRSHSIESETMPTIVHHSDWYFTRLPSGDAAGQSRRASAPLTMATFGAPVRSPAVNARPASSGTRSTAK